MSYCQTFKGKDLLDQSLIDNTTQIVITDNEFNKISRLIYDRVGIKLGEHKKSLVAGRLHKILKQYNLTNYSQYYKFISNDKTGEAINKLVDRISTNHTYFFRENEHFDYLMSTVFQKLTQNRTVLNQVNLRIWCAGCSSGEEPYTIAMLLTQFLGNNLPKNNPIILATDVSSHALDKAKQGEYSEQNMSHVPKAFRNKYFTKVPDSNWKVNESIKKLVLYRRLNLMRSLLRI